MEKQLFRFFFILLLGFLGLIIYLWVGTTPSIHAAGALHPKFSSMLKSGQEAANNSSASIFSYLFALFAVATLGFVLLIGMKKKGSLGPVKKGLIGGIIGFMLVFTGLTLSYWDYTSAETSSTYFGGFPTPTAWMLYGVPCFALFFTFLYLINFDNWVLTEEDKARFDEIIEKNNASKIE